MKSATETEVKISLKDRTSIGGRLKSAGLRVSVDRVFEANTLFDTKDGSLRGNGSLLRLREAGNKYTITFKGQGQPGPHKNRTELETSVGSLEALRQILERLGYAPTFRYEKYRTEFVPEHDPDAGTVTLDETPIGDFLEIEGDGNWIDSTAGQLGFSPQDYILESYGTLYLQHCQRLGLEPHDMIFASPK